MISVVVNILRKRVKSETLRDYNPHFCVILRPFEIHHIESLICMNRENKNIVNPSFRMAKQTDAEHIFSLYQNAKVSEFCVWNDSYPTIAEIAHDLETNNLYVMTDGNKIIGAISVFTMV